MKNIIERAGPAEENAQTQKVAKEIMFGSTRQI